VAREESVKLSPLVASACLACSKSRHAHSSDPFLIHGPEVSRSTPDLGSRTSRTSHRPR